MSKKSKHIRRLKTISLFGVSQLTSVLSIVILSLIIIRFHSAELWGQYAEVLIWTNVFLLFLSFGNNDYLLKSFSKKPSTINQKWLNNLIARSILLVPSMILIYFIPFFKGIEPLIFTLIILQFINQSFKSLIVYHRKFQLNIIIELLALSLMLSQVILKIEYLSLIIIIKIICFVHFIKLIAFSIFLFKDFKQIKLLVQFSELKKSLPFFIPLIIGTFRSKIDTYYGAHFFNPIQLSKYQVLISFLALAQMSSAFAITPYLKNFYRLKNESVSKIQKQFFIYGWIYAIIVIFVTFIILSKVYQLAYSLIQYSLAFIFIIPLFLHILLVSEYYKKEQQYRIALFTSIIVSIQFFIGYYLIKNWSLDGALLVKAFGQWCIVILLWVWIKRRK